GGLRYRAISKAYHRRNPETVRLCSGIPGRRNEENVDLLRIPAIRQIEPLDRNQVRAIGPTLNFSGLMFELMEVVLQLLELLRDHQSPNVAGGTAKKCFTRSVMPTASPSPMPLSGLSPSSSRKS